MKDYTFKPIGYVRTKSDKIPRHWSISDVEGEIIINPEYKLGLRDIKATEKIVVLFIFHKSSNFTPDLLLQKPPHLNEIRGVFSTCSPVRPNPIGLSVVEVVEVKENIIRVKGIDMFDKTPIIDIKPYMSYKDEIKKDS